jgi:trehalose synthase
VIERTSDLWWRNAVVYCLDVETFFDADGDGVGDLSGLTNRIDYLAGIGVTCLWLMPFYPSPNRDDGYDVVDFYGVDSSVGSLGDLVELLRTARSRGIRVIADLVVNHTSNRHPWFQESRAEPDSPRRDYYVWAEEIPEHDLAPVFPDAEDDVWSKDEEAGLWYLHHFYRHQPDLNVSDAGVRDEIAKVIGYWLELGLSGFRIDAVPFLIETYGTTTPEGRDPHDLLREMRAFASRRRGDHVLLGEVNLPVDDARRFFGDGDELQMLFAFTVNQALYLALARGEAGPLADALRALPALPDGCQWAHFARNHDELTLDQLGESERQEVFDAFGPEERMQLFGRGLRRRLPSMLDGDGARIRLVYSLVLSMPGTPVLFYGEEIGMAENLDIPGRQSVRTPMQWAPGPAGGFTGGDPADLRRPLTDDPRFGPDAVNVSDQRRDPESLLNWMERMIRLRKERPEIGWGEWEVLDAGHPGVLAHRCEWSGRVFVALHNLAGEEARAELAIDDGLEDLLGSDAGRSEHGRITADLEPYGYRWLGTP